uniref:UBC core domain-containing protein n=1 Tax=Euplotes harpa TaxID=151035 RepID=A0A7S3N252_9SPIT|mmetsp:Transcript_12365/g.14143  ORF Transcript_12365/g.14143 Transcript_12365/m.14143 type:complete len:184 (+) Transcript_12365:46-597(+)
MFKTKAIREINSLRDSEFCQVLTKFKNMNDPVIIRINVNEEETKTRFKCEESTNIGRNPYEGGFFLLELILGNTYPNTVPTVIFKTPIIHANISEKDGYICLDALNGWNSITNNILDNVIRPIVELLANPNFEDKIHSNNTEVPYDDYKKIRDYVREHATLEKSNEKFELIKERIKRDKELAK